MVKISTEIIHIAQTKSCRSKRPLLSTDISSDSANEIHHTFDTETVALQILLSHSPRSQLCYSCIQCWKYNSVWYPGWRTPSYYIMTSVKDGEMDDVNSSRRRDMIPYSYFHKRKSFLILPWRWQSHRRISLYDAHSYIQHISSRHAFSFLTIYFPLLWNILLHAYDTIRKLSIHLL